MPVSERVRVATLPLLLLVASLQVAIGQLIADPEPQAVVSTKYGDVLGHRSNASDRVRVYEGIPYASHARWQLPEPPQPWDGVLNGSESKTRCIQVKADFPDMMAHVPQSEECLELAVWTPAAGQQREELPTVVYIHGGGFAIGSAYDQDKSLFANATDTVVVAMNYRLGVFGFMAHPDLADQQTNFGLHDQLMALKWVKDNIAAFGGDPDDVTLVGYSAGADSVLYHLTWNESWPFFRRAAAFSPSTGFRPITLAEGLVIRGKGFEEAMGVESLEGLMNASATSLNEASPSSMDTGVCQCDPSLPEWRTALRQGGSAAGGGGGGGGGLRGSTGVVASAPSDYSFDDKRTTYRDFPAPVIDGDVLRFTTPLQAMEAGDVARVPLLLSSVSEETQWWTRNMSSSSMTEDMFNKTMLQSYGNETGARLLATQYSRGQTDGWLRAYARLLGALSTNCWTDLMMRSHPAAAYLLFFDTVTPTMEAMNASGAYHGMDMDYLFATGHFFDMGKFDDQDWQISNHLWELSRQFVRDEPMVVPQYADTNEDFRATLVIDRSDDPVRVEKAGMVEYFGCDELAVHEGEGGLVEGSIHQLPFAPRIPFAMPPPTAER